MAKTIRAKYVRGQFLETKKVKVDDNTRVELYVDGVWRRDIECHSLLSVKEASNHLIEQYES